MWDVFINHASEDKRGCPQDPSPKGCGRAASAFSSTNPTLSPGDSLSRQIDRGIVESKYGVVITRSPNFFKSKWAQRELAGLTTREMSSGITILTVWHKVTREEVERFSPSLGDKVAVPTSEGNDQVIQKILRVILRGKGAGTSPIPAVRKSPSIFFGSIHAEELGADPLRLMRWHRELIKDPLRMIFSLSFFNGSVTRDELSSFITRKETEISKSEAESFPGPEEGHQRQRAEAGSSPVKSKSRRGDKLGSETSSSDSTHPGRTPSITYLCN